MRHAANSCSAILRKRPIGPSGKLKMENGELKIKTICDIFDCKIVNPDSSFARFRNKMEKEIRQSSITMVRGC